MQVAEPSAKASAGDGELFRTIQRFAAWLEKTGYSSFDPYDVWGTKYGAWSRKVYYKRGAIALPLIAPILLLEIVCPSLRRSFVRKERFATADGQLILAMMNLHEVTGQQSWLKKAAALADEVLAYSVPGYRGYCWGYPFDWQNNRTFWPKNTPYITSTPYCFEAFLALHDATGEQRYLDVAASIAEFVAFDLRDTPTGDRAAAGSYSPIDNSKVINASAYRAMVLFEAAARFGREEFREKAEGNLNFILQNQREDGSWLYGLDGPKSAFIDHFHTAFVLKNLFKLNERLGSVEVKESIRKGYAYYRKNLFDAANDPRSFTVAPRFQIVQLEMYNFAEAITLGALLRGEIPEAFELAYALAQRLGERHQLPDGHFVTRVFRGGLRHKFPFLRWPQAQLFYGLTNLLYATAGKGGEN
jgi:uncharacterized protein YyaL (SSP411 family)